MARVFSAIEIEKESILNELAYVRDTINLGFKPVKASDMHITLEFFDDLDEKGIEKYKNRLSSTQIGKFESKVQGISSFPSQNHIRVVWAGLAEEKEIRKLYKIISQHNLDSSNKHNFKPHITLLRVENTNKRRKNRLKSNIREFENHEFGLLEIEKIKLFESEITYNGSNYKLIEEFKL